MNEVSQFIQKGGVVMYPLIACSIVLIAIAIERTITLRKALDDGDALLDEVKASYAPGGSPAAAIDLVGPAKTPLSRMFLRGLRNAGREPDAIEMAMEQEAANDAPMLDANLMIVRTIVNIAPLLGLLGTIGGMISAFRAASERGLSNPTEILSGISEALVSTASGIVVAIVGFLVYNYFANASKKLTEDMEYFGAELVNYLTGRLE